MVFVLWLRFTKAISLAFISTNFSTLTISMMTKTSRKIIAVAITFVKVGKGGERTLSMQPLRGEQEDGMDFFSKSVQ